MSARKSMSARLLLAMTGVAALSAAAWAQPRNTLRYEGDPVHTQPLDMARDMSSCVGTITVDGQSHDLFERGGVRAGVIEALERAGYDVWLEGSEIVVDIRYGTPRIRFNSREYSLSTHRTYETLNLTIRPRYRPHEGVEIIQPPIGRDRHRAESPAIIFDLSIGRGGGGRDRGGYRGERGRTERPGHRDDRRGREAGRPERYELEGDGFENGGFGDRPTRGRGPREFGGRGNVRPPSYETQRFDNRGRGDQGVTFDLDAGFENRQVPLRRR